MHALQALSIFFLVNTVSGLILRKRAVDFFNPVSGGGSMLDNGMSSASREVY